MKVELKFERLYRGHKKNTIATRPLHLNPNDLTNRTVLSTIASNYYANVPLVRIFTHNVSRVRVKELLHS